MSRVFLITVCAIFIAGCQSKKAVAMDSVELNGNSIKISGIKGQITPQVIEDVKKRREKYIRLHGSI